MPKWLIVLLLIFSVLFATWLIWTLFISTDKPHRSKDDLTTPTTFSLEDGKYGYIIRQDNIIYFIPEKDVPDSIVQNESWNDLSTFSGHPTGYILFGKPIERNHDILTTGVKVRIWYTQILETFPAQIEVLKIIVFYD